MSHMNEPTLAFVALGFQALCTLALAGVHFGLWRARGLPAHRSWMLAWALYALRLGFISMFLATRQEAWLFLHQTVTGWAAMLLLWAAIQFDRGARWKASAWWIGLASPAWAAFAVFGIRNYAVAGVSSTVLLFAVTVWTSLVFFHRHRRRGSTGALVLAWGFAVWAVHHLDYPLLRPQGAGLLYGVFADVGLIVWVAVGTLVLVLGEEREALEDRSLELERLTQRLLRAQEEERRRIARELHDEVGQVLTALKIELDLEGRSEASALAARSLAQVRDLSNVLRSSALDDLGLVPALRTMAEEFAGRTQLEVRIEAPEAGEWTPEIAVALYRVAQEALTNVARHAGARRAWLRLERVAGHARLVIEDDGRGPGSHMNPNLGLLGMQERVSAVGGTLHFDRGDAGGLRVEALMPLGRVS